MTTPVAITFDWHGTLADHQLSVGRGRQFRDYLASQGLSGDPWDRRVLYEVFDFYAGVYRPELSNSEKQSIWREFTRLLFKRSKVSCPSEQIGAHARAISEVFGPSSFRLFGEAKETLSALKAKNLRLGIISNWQRGLNCFCEELGIAQYFDVIISSADVGYEKPDARIFGEALVRLAGRQKRPCMLATRSTTISKAPRLPVWMHCWSIGAVYMPDSRATRFPTCMDLDASSLDTLPTNAPTRCGARYASQSEGQCMTVTDLERLFAYGYWANKKLFQVVSKLTPEEFTETVAGSYGSVRNTLVHVLSTEWGWLDRCGGPERGAALKPEDYPTVESLIDTWTQVEAYMRAFLARLTDADLARVVEFTNPRGDKRSLTVCSLMQHAANHGVHHRGQVALLLRLLGHAPGNVDVLFYDFEICGTLPK